MPDAPPRGVALVRPRDPGFATASRRSDLTRVRAGVYADARRWRSSQPWERYLARVRAVALTWTDPVFCLESAAALTGMPLFGEPRDIHVLVAGGKSRRIGDVVIHATRDDVDVVRADGIAATSRTATAVALCRVLPPAFALAVADHTLRTLGHPLDFGRLARETSDRRGRHRVDGVPERATATMRATPLGDKLARAGLVPGRLAHAALLATLQDSSRTLPRARRNPRTA